MTLLKKRVLLVSCIALFLVLVGGCSRKDDGIFTKDNEIFTYEKIDREKTQIVVSIIGNIGSGIWNICAEFEKRNPDVQIIIIDITGGSGGISPFVEWLEHGDIPDIMFNGLDGELAREYCENLSGKPYTMNFYVDALNDLTMEDGNIYMLPGPSDIDCIAYNKTLFEQYGWQVPKTFDDFVELCVRIRTDTNGEVQPWNPNAKYDESFLTALEAFSYGDVFAGAENRGWYDDFCNGKATFAGHMEPFYDRIQKLIDNGILLEEHFSYSATTRGKEFLDGKIAMYNAPLKSEYISDKYEFDFMPYPGKEAGDQYLNQSYSVVLGLSKKERTEEEREAVERFMAYYSSKDGQSAYIGTNLMNSNVKDVRHTNSAKIASIQPYIDEGHLFTVMRFNRDGWKRNFSIWDDAKNMVLGKKTAGECIAGVDREPYKLADENADAEQEVVGTVAEDFTILETSEYFADMYRKATSAEIGLIVNNMPYRGNLMKMFAGNLTPKHVTVLMPRSLGNGTHLIKCSMTGRQLCDALNNPVGDEKTVDAIYAFSGLECEVVPWNALGGKYVSIKLADGSEIEEDRLYTVAFWEGTVGEEYISEVIQTVEGTWQELMTARLKEDTTIKPARDGRIELIWE